MQLPKRIVLSRKGFDTSFGGCASPIFLDGRMVSFPIPDGVRDSKVTVTYGDLGPAYGHSILRMIALLHPKDAKWDRQKVHLDPDLRPELRPWNKNIQSGFFGQANGPQTILAKQGVCDPKNAALFLFYGFFRNVLDHGDDLKYVRGLGPDPSTHKQHVIWGWLQVGSFHSISPSYEDKDPRHADHHPHMQDRQRYRNNSLYIARKQLSFDEAKRGFGVFEKYHLDLRLTALDSGNRMSHWKVPPFLRKTATGPVKTQWDKQPKNAKNLFYRGPGQEFVFDTSDPRYADEVGAWLAKLFSHA